MMLADDSKLLAFVCIVLAGRTGNRIPLDRDFIQKSGHLERRPDVRPLIKSGLCELTEDGEPEIPASEMEQDASTSLANASTKTETEKSREETPKTIHPTREEVREFCMARRNEVDPDKWFDYYSANGWRVGRNPMKDWRAAVRTWERKNFGGPFRDGYEEPARKQQHRTAQHERASGNLAAAAAAFGDIPNMAAFAPDNGSRQTPRLSSSNPPVLEGEVKKLS